MEAERKVASNHPRNLLSLAFILGMGLLFATQWGPGARGCELPFRSKSTEAAAVVNGREIPLRRYSEAYSRQLDFYRRQGQSIPDSLAQQFGIPQKILDSLVDQELLTQAAAKQGISVSDAEVAALIQKFPDFQKDGKFDEKLYRDTLRESYRQTYAEFEAQLRGELSARKLLEVVGANASVSNDELRARYDQQGNKANVTYVRFLDSMFVADVPKPRDAEISAYAKTHAKDVQDYYTANQFQYHQKERVKARHILVKVDKDAPAAEKEKAKARLEALRKEIQGGKDFAVVAKASSEDPGSKAQGGDLGFNERENWVPEFATVAFTLKPGELSQPVQTPFGFHLIQVQEKKGAEDKQLKDVQTDIATLLWKKEKAKALAKDRADKALVALKAGKSLKVLYPGTKAEGTPSPMNFETESKPEAKESGEFTASQDTVPQLGPAPELAKDVFAASSPKALERVYPVGEGFVVAQVTLRTRPSDADFQKSHATLMEEALKAKQFELEQGFEKSLRKDAKITTNANIAKAARARPSDNDSEG